MKKTYFLIILSFLILSCVRPENTIFTEPGEIKTPQYCEKRCSGGERLENIPAIWHCATEPILNEDGTVQIAGLSLAADASTNTSNLQLMIDYFSTLYTNQSGANGQEGIFIPSGTFNMNNLDIKTGILLVGSSSGETKLMSKGNGIINLALNDNIGLSQIFFDRYQIQQDKPGGSYIDISDNVFYVTTSSPNLQLYGNNITVSGNYFFRNTPGVAIMQGTDNTKISDDDAFFCDSTHRYGSSTSGISACEDQYLKILPSSIEIDLSETERSLSEIATIKQFPSMLYETNDSGEEVTGAAVECEVEWKIVDTSKAINKPFLSSGETSQEIEPKAIGQTKIEALLVSSASSMSRYMSRNVTFSDNFFGKPNWLETSFSADLVKFKNKLDTKKKEKPLFSQFYEKNDISIFTHFWVGNYTELTQFHNNLFSDTSTSFPVYNHHFCETDFLGNVFLSDNKSISIKNGQYSNFFQNYLKRTQLAIKSDVIDFYLFYNYFDANNQFVVNFDNIKSEKIKNNFIYKPKLPFKNPDLFGECEKDNTKNNSYCLSKNTPDLFIDNTKEFSSLSTIQKKNLNLFARKIYPKNSKGKLEPENYPSDICKKYTEPTDILVNNKLFVADMTYEVTSPCNELSEQIEQLQREGNSVDKCLRNKQGFCLQSFQEDNSAFLKGKIQPADIIIYDRDISEAHNSLKTYGCENPIGYKKDEQYVFIGSDMGNHNDEPIQRQIQAIDSLKKQFKEQYNAAIYTGYFSFQSTFLPSVPILYSHSQYQPDKSNREVDKRFIEDFKGAIRKINKHNGKSNMVSYKRGTMEFTYSGCGSVDNYTASGAYKFENDRFVIIQTNKNPDHAESRVEGDYGFICWRYRSEWTYHNSKKDIMNWIKTARAQNKMVVLLSEDWNDSVVNNLKKDYNKQFPDFNFDQDVLAFLYSSHYADRSQIIEKGCDGSDGVCVVRIGHSHEGLGLILGFDGKNNELTIYSVIDNKTQHIAPWIVLNYQKELRGPIKTSADIEVDTVSFTIAAPSFDPSDTIVVEDTLDATINLSQGEIKTYKLKTTNEITKLNITITPTERKKVSFFVFDEKNYDKPICTAESVNSTKNCIIKPKEDAYFVTLITEPNQSSRVQVIFDFIKPPPDPSSGS